MHAQHFPFQPPGPRDVTEVPGKNSAVPSVIDIEPEGGLPHGFLQRLMEGGKPRDPLPLTDHREHQLSAQIPPGGEAQRTLPRPGIIGREMLGAGPGFQRPGQRGEPFSVHGTFLRRDKPGAPPGEKAHPGPAPLPAKDQMDFVAAALLRARDAVPALHAKGGQKLPDVGTFPGQLDLVGHIGPGASAAPAGDGTVLLHNGSSRACFPRR